MCRLHINTCNAFCPSSTSAHARVPSVRCTCGRDPGAAAAGPATQTPPTANRPTAATHLGCEPAASLTTTLTRIHNNKQLVIEMRRRRPQHRPASVRPQAFRPLHTNQNTSARSRTTVIHKNACDDTTQRTAEQALCQPAFTAHALANCQPPTQSSLRSTANAAAAKHPTPRSPQSHAVTIRYRAPNTLTRSRRSPPMTALPKQSCMPQQSPPFAPDIKQTKPSQTWRGPANLPFRALPPSAAGPPTKYQLTGWHTARSIAMPHGSAPHLVTGGGAASVLTHKHRPAPTIILILR